LSVKDFATPQPTPIYSGAANQVYAAQTPAGQRVAVKVYAHRAAAEREFAVLSALRDFGINLGAEPLALFADEKSLIMSWIDGDPLPAPPAPDDTTAWNRIMAALGASGDMPFLEYTRQVRMRGTAPQQPADLLDDIQSRLAAQDPHTADYPRLAALLRRVRERVAPTWNETPPIGLCRRGYALHDFIWDGHHLLALDWENADWGDMAAEVGMLSAHPDFASVPTTHWVWFRWEFARLTKDPDLIPRATTYSKLAQLWWAVVAPPPLRQQYLARAEKLFPA